MSWDYFLFKNFCFISREFAWSLSDTETCVSERPRQQRVDRHVRVRI